MADTVRKARKKAAITPAAVEPERVKADIGEPDAPPRDMPGEPDAPADMRALRDAASRRLMALIREGKATAGDLLKVLATKPDEKEKPRYRDYVIVVDENK